MKILLVFTMLMIVSGQYTQAKPIERISYNPEKFLTDEDYRQIDCLSRNLFFEARNEGEVGMRAVGAVTLNRVGKYGSSICNVVYRYKQFSWVHLITERKQKRIIEIEYSAWGQAIEIAKDLYLNPTSIVGDRMHFLNESLVIEKYGRLPVWFTAHGKDPIKIGSHTFVNVKA